MVVGKLEVKRLGYKRAGHLAQAVLPPWPPSMCSRPCVTRKVFLFCLFAARGNLRTKAQVLHFWIRTSAQGFLPPLLLFSMLDVLVDPSSSIESQFLQIECFITGDIRIWLLWETARRSNTSRREADWNGALESLVESCAESRSRPSLVLASFSSPCFCCAKYVAAWNKYDTLLCKTLFGTFSLFLEEAVPLAMLG